MTPEETRTALIATADHIGRVGLAKESFFDTTGRPVNNRPIDWWKDAPCCSYGGLALVAGHANEQGHLPFDVAGEFYGSPAATKLADVMRGRLGLRWEHASPYTVITAYNDAESTTDEDVISAFREAAES